MPAAELRQAGSEIKRGSPLGPEKPAAGRCFQTGPNTPRGADRAKLKKPRVMAQP